MAAAELVHVSAGLSLSGGGAARLGRLVAETAARHCAERGLGFRVLHLGDPIERGLLSGIEVRDFRHDRRALARAVVAAQLPPGRAALVFDHLGPARVQALLTRRLRGRYLLWLLGIEMWRPLSWDRRRSLENATVRIAISETTRRRAHQVSPWLAGLPIEILHPVLGPAVEPVWGPAGLPDAPDLPERGYLLIVGRMAASERYKGHDSLLAAMPAVIAAHPGTRLVIVGEGDDRRRLAAASAAAGLAGSVTFTGHVSEAALAEIYSRAGVFVMPSDGEGFGLVYLEAMRAGKPCVAVRGGAAAEIVVDGETGLLLDTAAPGPLAAALTSLLADPGLAARLGEAGRRRERERFHPEAFRRRYDALLDRLSGAEAATEPLELTA